MKRKTNKERLVVAVNIWEAKRLITSTKHSTIHSNLELPFTME